MKNCRLYKGNITISLETKAFAGGGEGNLFHISEPLSLSHRFIVKIYHPHKLTLSRQEKLRYLLQNPPFELNSISVNPSVVWVHDLVLNEEGDVIGLMMPFVKGEKLELLSTLKLPKGTDPTWKRFDFSNPDAHKYRLRLCLNIAVAMQQVHSTQRYVLVDLKPDNIVIQPQGIISLVDMDSVEVVQGGESLFDAPVATPEYTAPEHYRALEYDPTARQAWDAFSMAVIFYKVLFGIHPFAGGSKSPYENCLTLEQKIEAGLFVHNREMSVYFSVIPPPHVHFEKLPEELKTLFMRCFVDGHFDPEIRPGAEEWCVELLKAIDDPKLNAVFGHLALPLREDFSVQRRLASQIMHIEDYSREKAGRIIPEYFKNINKHDDILKFDIQTPHPTEVLNMRAPKLKNISWMLFGFLVFLYNFGGKAIEEFLEALLEFIAELIEAFTRIIDLDDDFIIFILIGLLILLFYGIGRLSKMAQFYLTKEYRAKSLLSKKLEAEYAEINGFRDAIKQEKEKLNQSEIEKEVELLTAENHSKTEALKSVISEYDVKIKTLIEAETNALKQCYQNKLAVAKNLFSGLGTDIPKNLQEMKQFINENKMDASISEIATEFEHLLSEYQIEYKKIKDDFSEKHKGIIAEMQQQLKKTESDILKAENEAKSKIEAGLNEKISLAELEKLEKEIKVRKKQIENTEYEIAKYRKVTLKEYFKLK